MLRPLAPRWCHEPPVLASAGSEKPQRAAVSKQRAAPSKAESHHDRHELGPLRRRAHGVVPRLDEQRRTNATDRDTNATVVAHVRLRVLQALELIDRAADVLRHTTTID